MLVLKTSGCQNRWFGTMVRKPFGSRTSQIRGHGIVLKSRGSRTWLDAMVREPFGRIDENQSKDYSLDHGMYSEPGAPDYSARIDGCQKMLRETNVLKADLTQSLKNIDGKSLLKPEPQNYEKEYEARKSSYLTSVTKNNSFIKAELDFNSTKFLR